MGRPRSNLPRTQVRMKEEMMDLLIQRADAGYRSLNAEIVSLIERGLAAEKAASSHTA